MKGISLWPAEVEVHNDTELRGVDTKLGNVPILGFVLAQVAKSQYEQNKPAATREVEQKIIRQASERVDAEAREQLAGMVAKLNQRVFDPLNNLSLDPQLIDAETTERRFTMRLRVGGEDQIGSHTPRPQAPDDSLASVQLHESVLNNGLRRLQLEGRTFTLPQLSQHVAKSLNCTPWRTSPENEDVKITFAQQDPVVVRCQGGQVVLTFSMQRLSKAPHRWNNFQVRAFYRPEVAGAKRRTGARGGDPLDGATLEHRFADRAAGHLLPRPVEEDPLRVDPQEDRRRPEAQGRGDHAVRDRGRLAGPFARPQAARCPGRPPAAAHGRMRMGLDHRNPRGIRGVGGGRSHRAPACIFRSTGSNHPVPVAGGPAVFTITSQGGKEPWPKPPPPRNP